MSFGRRDFLKFTGIGTLALPRRSESADKPPQPNPKASKMNPRLFTFLVGDAGPWKFVESKRVIGEGLPEARALSIVSDFIPAMPDGVAWLLRGVTSNERYVTRSEKDQLVMNQAGLGRPETDCAALIPIPKYAAWWAMTQDVQRKVFEDESNHTVTGLKYLPAIARRLHHCRDLHQLEPFDFLTWFEFSKTDTGAFDLLVKELHATPEWTFVEREVEIRVVRNSD